VGPIPGLDLCLSECLDIQLKFSETETKSELSIILLYCYQVAQQDRDMGAASRPSESVA
jgi:hypothetical protein